MRLGNPGVLRACRRHWLAVILLSVTAVASSLLLTSCRAAPTPKAAPTPPQPTPVYSSEIGTKLPPVIFVMLDWMNGDWGNPDYRWSYVDQYGYRQDYRGHPEFGALGGWTEFHWSDLNPEKGVYDWSLTDKFVKDAQAMQVTLPDGSVIAKPVGIAVVCWTADSTADRIGFNYIPVWVANQGGGSTWSCYDPDGSGPCKPFCTPKFTNTVWQYWFDQFLMAMGRHYDNNPEFYNLAWLAIHTGVDGETVERKNLFGCSYAGDTLAFTNWCSHVFESYNLAFPNTPHFIQATVHNSYYFSRQAATYASRMSGVKVNGLEPDVSSAEVRYDGVLVGGVTGFSDVYHEQIPTGYEPKRGNGIEGSYWFFMQGLSTHPYIFDVQLPNISDTYLAEQRTGFPILNFVRNHLGKSIQDTPDVWTVLRDTHWQDTSWLGSDGIRRTYGPHHGDLQYWLYRSDTAPGSRSVFLNAETLYAELPPLAAQHIYAWHSTRRTDQGTSNPYLSFDIDDAYPYVGQVPRAAGGQVSWSITVTLVNTGADTFSLEYVDYYGNLVERRVTKGAALGTMGNWVDYTFRVDDAYMNNGLPGGMDFRIDCNGDGNEIVHRLIVKAEGPTPPTPTPTRTRPPTATPTETLTPTTTRTPTYTPTGTITPPTPTNTVVVPPTRTRTPTPTRTGTPGPSATPTNTPTLGPSPMPTSTPTPFPGGHNVITLQQGVLGYQGANDTYITMYTPSGNFGLQANLVVKNDSVYEGLLRFDVGGVPISSTVSSAILRLYAYNRDKNAALDVQVYRMLRDWVDTQATWDRAALDRPWGAAGANDTASDRQADPVAVQTMSTLGDWYEFDVTGLVRDWVAKPGDNHGLVLRGAGQVSLVYHLASSNNPTISYRPQLVLDYTAPEQPVTPTPLTPVATATRTATRTATPLASATATATSTPGPSLTATPQGTATPARTPIETATATPTETGTPAPTPQGTATPAQTGTPGPTPTNTPTPFPGGHNVLTLQQGVMGYLGTRDTYITSFTPAGSFSLQANLIVKNDNTYLGLLRFDLGSVPPGSTLNSATLRLCAYNRDKSGALDLQVYRLLRPWVDAQATWNRAALDSPWAAAGANDTTTDRAADPVSVQTVAALNTWYEFDVSALVRDWIAAPGSNRGVALRALGSVSLSYHLASGNHSTISVRPQLVIDYTAPEQPRTPTASPVATRTLTPTAGGTLTPTPAGTLQATSTATQTPSATTTPQPTPTAVGEDVIVDMERRVGILEQLLRAIIDILQRAGKIGR